MFVFRAAFWLVVLTLFLPPEYRPLPFVEFKLPERLGHGAQSRGDIPIPNNHYCAEHEDVCVDVANALDAITAIGLVGLGFVKATIEADSDRITRGDDEDSEDKPILGRLIDS
jgi:hypothetical protein